MDQSIIDELVKELVEDTGKTEEEVRAMMDSSVVSAEFMAIDEEALGNEAIQFLDDLRERSGLEENDFQERICRAVTVAVVDVTEESEYRDASAETLYGVLLGFYFTTEPLPGIREAMELCQNAITNAVMEECNA